MKKEHILDILDEKSFAELSAAELNFVKAHAAGCQSCEKAFQAARVSSVLLKTESVEDFSPSPFFQTRLTANLRERREKLNPFAALMKLWRASAAMVLMMAAFVVGLIGLTIFAPEFNEVSGSSNNPQAEIYSTDMVIAGERFPVKEPTNEQVFRIIYASESVTKK